VALDKVALLKWEVAVGAMSGEVGRVTVCKFGEMGVRRIEEPSEEGELPAEELGWMLRVVAIAKEKEVYRYERDEECELFFDSRDRWKYQTTRRGERKELRVFYVLEKRGFNRGEYEGSRLLSGGRKIWEIEMEKSGVASRAQAYNWLVLWLCVGSSWADSMEPTRVARSAKISGISGTVVNGDWVRTHSRRCPCYGEGWVGGGERGGGDVIGWSNQRTMNEVEEMGKRARELEPGGFQRHRKCSAFAVISRQLAMIVCPFME
jgi:hypothetical protein